MVGRDERSVAGGNARIFGRGPVPELIRGGGPSPSKTRPAVRPSVGVRIEMRIVGIVSKAAYLVLAVAFFGVAPTQVAFQDIGSWLGPAPAVADRAREHLITSPF